MKTENKILNSYQDYYENGSSLWRKIGAKQKVNNIIEACKNIPHSKILEVGSGEGSILKELSNRKFGEELSSVEISKSGLKTIKKRNVPRLKECRIFDGYSLPYDDDEFDVVILTHVLEHVEYPRKLIYEIQRVATHVFVEVPLEDTIRLPDNFKASSVGHINYYNPKSIRRLIQSCNAKIILQKTINPGKKSYLFEDKIFGGIKYFLKNAFLKVSPSFATKIFTYHSFLLFRKIV